MDGSEGEGDLVLIQTFFALLWKLFFENTSKHKNNLIYIIKQEGLYQNKHTLSLASIYNCKMAYFLKIILISRRNRNLKQTLFRGMLILYKLSLFKLCSTVSDCTIFPFTICTSIIIHQIMHRLCL